MESEGMNNGDGEQSSGDLGPSSWALATLGMVGVIGNALVLHRFCRRKEHPGRLIVLFISVVDMAACVIAIPLTIYIELRTLEVDDRLCMFYEFALSSFFAVTCLLLIVALLERFFHYRESKPQLQNPFTAGSLSMGIVTLITGMGMASYLTYHHQYYYETCDKRIFQFGPTGIIKIIFIFVYLLFAVLVVAMMGMIFRKMCQNNRSEGKPTTVAFHDIELDEKGDASNLTENVVQIDPNDKMNFSVTIRFFVICVIFWFCYFPTFLVDMYILPVDTFLSYVFYFNFVFKPFCILDYFCRNER